MRFRFKASVCTRGSSVPLSCIWDRGLSLSQSENEDSTVGDIPALRGRRVQPDAVQKPEEIDMFIRVAFLRFFNGLKPTWRQDARKYPMDSC